MSAHVLYRPVIRRSRRPAMSWFSWLAAALRAIETRRQLAEMDSRMLQDIGVSRSEAFAEAERAPWDFAPRDRC